MHRRTVIGRRHSRRLSVAATTPRRAEYIGGASYGAVGHVPPSTYNNLIFQCTLTYTKSDSDYTSTVASFKHRVTSVPLRLQITYGITDTALVWFASYLHERKLSVRYRGSSSTTASLLCGVPQGSVLGPILFLMYTADLLGLIEGMDLHPHLYADDTQIYGFCAPDEVSALQQCLSLIHI